MVTNWRDDAVPVITVVGCGGTGGFVAEGLCRLLQDRPAKLVLIDHDRVEPHNLRRQPFYQGDMGKFKAQVLAERLARLYGREIGYKVVPYSSTYSHDLFAPGLVIGCVDNGAARAQIATSIRSHQWWIDAGNDHQSGQVLIGNTEQRRILLRCFLEEVQGCYALPLPSWQQPSLLIAMPPPPMDCAEAVEAGDQSPTINQVMATLVLEIVRRLLAGTLSWMGVYIDLEIGTLRPVLIEPKTVARMTGLQTKSLVDKKSKEYERRY